MKTLVLLFCLQIIGTPLFSQEWRPNIHVQNTNMVVRWKAPKHPWPKVVGIYHALPTRFLPSVISNLTVLGSFTEKDKRDYGTNGIILGQPYSLPHLDLSFSEGEIRYDSPYWKHYSVTNLAPCVPEERQLPHSLTNFLPMLGIGLSELAKDRNDRLVLTYPDVSSGFPGAGPHGEFLTNFISRSVIFHRNINGARFFYRGGWGELTFGEYGRVVRIDLSWPDLKCDQLYAAATPDEIVQRIRQGQALQRHLLDLDGNETFIDWSTVKSLTITNAEVWYYRGDTFIVRGYAPQLNAPNLVYPDAELWGFIDTGKEKTRVGIVCPVIDETARLSSDGKR